MGKGEEGGGKGGGRREEERRRRVGGRKWKGRWEMATAPSLPITACRLIRLAISPHWLFVLSFFSYLLLYVLSI
jgi:hypothetical protein